jgi:excinuclease ABC subunit C
MTCIQVFFFRTGQNWGNRAYFPKADASLEPARRARSLHLAILRQQAGAAPDPGSETLPEADLLAEALVRRRRAR